jgi:hypothetical protein
MSKEQLVKTPDGEWVLLTNYLCGGDVFQLLPTPNYKICVRLFPTKIGENNLILKNNVETLEKGHEILDEWIEKVNTLRNEGLVEQPIKTPKGDYILLSKYSEVWIGGKSNSGHALVTFSTSEEGDRLRKELAEKMIEARQNWL